MTRKTISLLTLFSFLALILSSVALYILPGGRDAPLNQLLMLGVHKATWKSIHTTGGFLFLGAAVWHTVLNWRAIVSYMKKATVPSWKSACPLLAALAVTAFVYTGTIYGLEPMNTILTAPRQLASAKTTGVPGTAAALPPMSATGISVSSR